MVNPLARSWLARYGAFGWVWGFYFSIAIANWGRGFQMLETQVAGEKQ